MVQSYSREITRNVLKGVLWNKYIVDIKFCASLKIGTFHGIHIFVDSKLIYNCLKLLLVDIVIPSTRKFAHLVPTTME